MRPGTEITETEAPDPVDPASNLGESIRSIVSDLGEHASVRSVYGDPIEVDGTGTRIVRFGDRRRAGLALLGASSSGSSSAAAPRRS